MDVEFNIMTLQNQNVTKYGVSVKKHTDKQTPAVVNSSCIL